MSVKIKTMRWFDTLTGEKLFMWAVRSLHIISFMTMMFSIAKPFEFNRAKENLDMNTYFELLLVAK